MQRPKSYRLVLCSLMIIALVPGSLWASDTPIQADQLGPVNPKAGITIDDLSDGYTRGTLLAARGEDWLLAQADDQEPIELDNTDVLGYKPKSPKRAFLQSLLIPGWGQWYTGNRWKPFLFLGLEAAGWASWSNYRKNGNDIQDDYEVFADEHWHYENYEHGLQAVFNIAIDTMPYIVIENLVEKERVFSHHIYPLIPGDLNSIPKDETYYENLGKYDQFAYGWDDFNDGVPIESPEDTTGIEWVSPNRRDYLNQRDKSNREFSKASTVLILTMANHLLSAFEAAWSAQRYNRAIDQFGTIEPHLQLTRSPESGKLKANLALRYNF